MFHNFDRTYLLETPFLHSLDRNYFVEVVYLLDLFLVGNLIVAYFDYWIIFDRAEIATIGVKEEYRHLGYGQKMMNYIVEQAELNGCENVSLEVRVSNDKAIKLYEKNGFIKASKRKGYYSDGEDAWLMVKPVGGSNDTDSRN